MQSSLFLNTYSPTQNWQGAPVTSKGSALANKNSSWAVGCEPGDGPSGTQGQVEHRDCFQEHWC